MWIGVTVETVVKLRILTNVCSNKILKFRLPAVNDSDVLVPTVSPEGFVQLPRLAQQAGMLI